jgi:hypothetical protein
MRSPRRRPRTALHRRAARRAPASRKQLQSTAGLTAHGIGDRHAVPPTGGAATAHTERAAPNVTVNAHIAISSLLSRGNFGGCRGALVRSRSVRPAGSRRVQFWVRVVTSPKSRWFRCEPVTQATETFLKCPARARWSAGGDSAGVGSEVPPGDVAEPPFQRPDRFALGSCLRRACGRSSGGPGCGGDGAG